jgi:afadin
LIPLFFIRSPPPRPSLATLTTSSPPPPVQSQGGERRLEAEESPLLCQLAWNKDDREGRFLLKSANEKTEKWNDSFGSAQDGEAQGGDTPEKERKSGFARASKRFSKRATKKKEKQKEKENNEKNSTAEDLYKSSFSRTISNPEMVMKRRRQLKLEKKLQDFRSKDGAPDRGGTLKI